MAAIVGEAQTPEQAVIATLAEFARASAVASDGDDDEWPRVYVSILVMAAQLGTPYMGLSVAQRSAIAEQYADTRRHVLEMRARRRDLAR